MSEAQWSNAAVRAIAVWQECGHQWMLLSKDQYLWFSWHESAHQLIREWHATKMLLGWYHGTHTLPDPDSAELLNKKTFQEFRKGYGGLKLAYLVCSEENWQNTILLLEAGRPLWSWYANEIIECKGGEAGLSYALNMANSWFDCEQLMGLASLLTSKSLTVFHSIARWSEDMNAFSDKATRYIVNLMGQRAMSLSKHSAPPYSWAQVLSNDPNAIQDLKLDWQYLTEVEHSKAPFAESLAQDLRLCFDAPTRLVCLQYLAGEVEGALETLKSILGNLPDAKVVEDVHQRLRVSQKKHSNDVMTRAKIQMIVNQSGVLEARGVKHVGKITKDSFIAQWPVTRATFEGKSLMNLKSKTHKLPKLMSKMLSKVRTWPALSEANLAASFSGWFWLRFYRNESLHRNNVKIKEIVDGLRGLVAQRGYVIQLRDNHQDGTEPFVWLVLASLKWAVLVWRLQESMENPLIFQPDVGADAGVGWLSLHNVTDWVFVPTQNCWNENLGIHFKKLGGTESLIKHSLRQPKRFIFNDLVVLAESFGLVEKGKSCTRAVLLRRLAEHFGDGEEDFAQGCLMADGKKSEKDDDEENSAFIDCLLENCDSDERQEYSCLKSQKDLLSDAEIQQWRQWRLEKEEEEKVIWL
eukprot:Skav213422  [mRNA]  locus=scaffold38:257004:267612:+ [translate_table: standard]